MKDEILDKLRNLEQRLRDLRADIKKVGVERVGRKEHRDEAEAVADFWVEELRSPLEHRFKVSADTVTKYAEGFKRLHVLSRPNNLAKSYAECLSGLLKRFKDDLVLPIQQSDEPITGNAQLNQIVGKIQDDSVSEYLVEAVSCAQSGYKRAGIVMGWCAAVDHIHKKLVMLGLDKFNTTSTKMKQQDSGRFRRFNKEYKVTTLNELQEIFDTDLVWILEGMELVDSNQGDRLRTCFQYRNQSAHPGEAPINEHHLAAFFSDIVDIVLTNPKFSPAPIKRPA
jgi:hypothetical protein